MQIYNEKIYDLLQDKKRENPLQIRDVGREGIPYHHYYRYHRYHHYFYHYHHYHHYYYHEGNYNVHVSGLSMVRVYGIDDVMLLLKNGLQNRATRSTGIIIIITTIIIIIIIIIIHDHNNY
jgi:hypothetical protein